MGLGVEVGGWGLELGLGLGLGLGLRVGLRVWFEVREVWGEGQPAPH